MRGAREVSAPRDSLNFRRASLLSRNEFKSGTSTIVLHATSSFTYVSVIYGANFPFKAGPLDFNLSFWSLLTFAPWCRKHREASCVKTASKNSEEKWDKYATAVSRLYRVHCYLLSHYSILAVSFLPCLRFLLTVDAAHQGPPGNASSYFKT